MLRLQADNEEAGVQRLDLIASNKMLTTALELAKKELEIARVEAAILSERIKLAKEKILDPKHSWHDSCREAIYLLNGMPLPEGPK